MRHLTVDLAKESTGEAKRSHTATTPQPCASLKLGPLGRCEAEGCRQTFAGQPFGSRRRIETARSHPGSRSHRCYRRLPVSNEFKNLSVVGLTFFPDWPFSIVVGTSGSVLDELSALDPGGELEVPITRWRLLLREATSCSVSAFL